MPLSISTPKEELIELLRQNKVIPFIGAGVASAAANLPNWHGTIESGLAYATIRQLDATEIAAGRALLAKQDLTGSANVLKKLLNAPQYPFSDWIASLFHNAPIQNEDLLKSIAYLCAPIILTTNYDNTLSAIDLPGRRQVYTWQEYQLVREALRRGDSVLVHLHGMATRPDTVILSTDDYAVLNREQGYKEVLQQMWNDYHFLFIGCSTNGIQDDDFSTVIRFLRQWFPHSRHHHYALLSQQNIDRGLHKGLLYDCNIETISLGNDYAKLPELINSFNPNLPRFLEAVAADRERLRRVAAELHEQLHIQNGQVAAAGQQLNALLRDTLPGGIYWIASPQLNMMEQALREANQALATSKQKLVFFQDFVRGLIDHSEVTAAVEQWNAQGHTPALLSNAKFVNAAIICYECLERLPRELLQEIAYRAPYAIHAYYFAGHLDSFIHEFKHMRHRLGEDVWASYTNDRYFFENLKRIIDSIRGFLELDAEQLFGEVKPAVLTKSLPASFLMLLTQTTLSVRELSAPYTELACLKSEANLPFLGVQAGFYNDQRYLIGFTARRAFYWNPVQELLPTYFFDTDGQGSIQEALLDDATNSLQLTVIAGGHLYRFENFMLVSRTQMAESLNDIVRLADVTKYYGIKTAYTATRGPILFQLTATGEVQPLLSTVEAWRLASRGTQVQQAIQALEEAEEDYYDYPFLQGGQLHSLPWGQDLVLSYRAKIAMDNFQATLLLIGQPTAEGFEPLCTVVVPHKLSIAFATLRTQEGEANLLLGYLATRNQPANLLQVVESLTAGDHVEVGDDSSFLPTGVNEELAFNHDITSLIWPIVEKAFGVQGSQKLLCIDPLRRECSAIEVNGLRKVITV